LRSHALLVSLGAAAGCVGADGPFSTGSLESGVTERSAVGLGWNAAATLVPARTRVPRFARDGIDYQEHNDERGGQDYKAVRGRVI
jgi:hypothetical protein